MANRVSNMESFLMGELFLSALIDLVRLSCEDIAMVNCWSKSSASEYEISRMVRTCA